MKRRSAAAALEGKWRRPIKRSPKIADNFYGGSVVYVKLLLLWLVVLLSDYFLEFRFEYLWPFWLFLRSVYDSFKYQGLAFSVFFICIAVTSDMICFLFIPVHWLFFAASTYVWVQYVWHTEKGVCVPTMALWLLFVYVEAAIRLREFKAHVDMRNLPFHLDLCRPFAAHCIGYPVVTLGFGFKSYVGYRMRQRKQKEVLRENEYYFDFLREALPPGQIREEAFNPQPSPKICLEDRLQDSGFFTTTSPTSSSLSPSSNSSVQVLSWNGSGGNCSSERRENGDLATESPSPLQQPPSSSSSSSGAKSPGYKSGGKMSNGFSSHGDLEYLEKSDLSSTGGGGGDEIFKKSSKSFGSSSSSSSVTAASAAAAAAASAAMNGKKSKEVSKLSKEELVVKLEQDIKRLKTDLQQSRNKENDLRDQIISYMSSERHLKSEISNLQVEKSVFESRLSGLLSTRAGEKASLAVLEKKLTEERKQKTEFQMKLESERKTKKETATAERTVRENQTRNEVLKLESEIKTLRGELQAARDRCHGAEQDVFLLRKYKETHGDPEVLMNALKSIQEKNNQIEKSLSAETKLKMDLFSALGDTKRELAIKQGMLSKKDKEISELRTKIAEVLAVMPHNVSAATTNSIHSGISSFAPTLTLDLPSATELSYGKLTSLGPLGTTSSSSASDFDLDSATNDNNSILYSHSYGSSLYSPQNGKGVNDV